MINQGSKFCGAAKILLDYCTFTTFINCVLWSFGLVSRLTHVTLSFSLRICKNKYPSLSLLVASKMQSHCE